MVMQVVENPSFVEETFSCLAISLMGISKNNLHCINIRCSMNLPSWNIALLSVK